MIHRSSFLCMRVRKLLSNSSIGSASEIVKSSAEYTLMETGVDTYLLRGYKNSWNNLKPIFRYFNLVHIVA